MLYVFSMEITYMHVSWSVQPTKLDLKNMREREKMTYFSQCYTQCFGMNVSKNIFTYLVHISLMSYNFNFI